MRFGYQFGVAWDNDFGNKLHFAPEILFIQKGFVLKNTQNGINDKFRMNYIEVPLIAKFDLNDLKGSRPFFSIGMTVSYYLGGNYEKTEYGSSSVSENLEEDPDKKIDIGALVGAGMDLGRFVFEFRGQIGFISPYYFDTGSHATISFNFSYLFGGSEEDVKGSDGFEDRF